MSKLCFYAAMAVAKGMRLALKVLGRNATYLPGKAAIKICPDFMGQLQMPKTVICVTGTNGKTTVSNLVTSILKSCGYSVTNNSYGSNVQAGVCTALLEDSTFSGKATRDVAVLEVDERSSLLVYRYIKPDYLLCNNIMRDSIKRNAHTDFISFIINKGIPAGTKLILNADDIICAHLGLENPDRTYFGISTEVPEQQVVPYLRDIVYCPECGTLLQDEYIRYNHIGRIHCPNCGYGTPKPDFCVTDIDRAEGSFTVEHDGVVENFKLVNDNITNLYNFCAVIALLNKLGIPGEKIHAAFDALEIVKSRHEEVSVGDSKLTVIMAKGQNPIAVTSVLNYVASCGGSHKSLLIAVDDMYDNVKNTENVSWIFDTDYRFLADPSIDQVVFTGKRCRDYYLRALMAGVDEKKLHAVESWQDGVDLVDIAGCKNIYLLYELYRYNEAMNMKNGLLNRLKGGEHHAD